MPGSKPTQPEDVAIHCGDLTGVKDSGMSQRHPAVERYQRARSNWSLQEPRFHHGSAFQQKLNEARPPLDLDLVRREYGDYGEPRTLFEQAQARDSGITYLDKGAHHFILDNGVSLTVYTSPYTPSLGDWGFQYHPEQGRDFSLGGADVVITHGPPKGAVARARPRQHCFGHIHEAWGAKLVSWRSTVSEHPPHFTDIGHGKSVLVKNLAGLDATTQGASARATCCVTSHCAGDTDPLEIGAPTLFVNAAILDSGYCPVQLPWLVDIELARAR